MGFSDDNLAIIKFFKVEKGYGARKNITECPTKQWSRSAVEKLLRKSIELFQSRDNLAVVVRVQRDVLKLSTPRR